MALFDKKTTETNIPELQEYYANQKRESTGLAWLLALGSLLVTAAVIIGLFVGGRWAYRKITNKNKTTVATVETTDSSSSTSTAPSNTPAQATSTTTTAATPAQGVTPAQSIATNTTAVAATTAKEVPNTGPGNVFALFMSITIIAAIAHSKFLAKKRAN